MPMMALPTYLPCVGVGVAVGVAVASGVEAGVGLAWSGRWVGVGVAVEQESALALEKERASLLAKLSVSAWVSPKEPVFTIGLGSA